MNPFFMLPALFRQVKCPKCKSTQMVTSRTAKEGFLCKYCRAWIPKLKEPKKHKKF